LNDKLMGWVGLGDEKWTHVHLCEEVRVVVLQNHIGNNLSDAAVVLSIYARKMTQSTN